MNKKKFACLITVLITIYYTLVYINLIEFKKVSEFPALKLRFSTLIWHEPGTTSSSGNINTYCYYPKGPVQFVNRGGEYILKRVDNYTECTDWFGVVFINESEETTEDQKLIWQ